MAYFRPKTFGIGRPDILGRPRDSFRRATLRPSRQPLLFRTNPDDREVVPRNDPSHRPVRDKPAVGGSSHDLVTGSNVLHRHLDRKGWVKVGYSRPSYQITSVDC